VPDSGAFCFEQPLNERIRTFLRMEHLFARLRYHQRDDNMWGRRATMTALMDILTVMARHDLRAEVSKALGGYYTNLKRLTSRDDVDSAQLDSLLQRLDTLGREIQHIPPQFASYLLRDNELLNSLNNRHAIPGGSCGFDIPSYQNWLRLDRSEIKTHLDRWCQRIVPLESAIVSLLQLLRDGTAPQRYEAREGVLVHQNNTDTQLIRVLVDDPHVYPEISAGRHRSTVRFMTFHDRDLHVRQCRSTIAFQMACCRL